MKYEFGTISWISFAGALAMAVAAILIRNRRNNPGAKPLFWLMLAACIWAAGDAMENAVNLLPAKIHWGQFQYIGTLSTPVFFLFFALEYTGRKKWLTIGRKTGFFAVPFITEILTLTNSLHGLVWPTVEFSAKYPGVAEYSHGPAFWLGTFGYGNALMMIGTYLIVNHAISLSKAHFQQSMVVLMAIIPPWLVSILYALRINPFPGLELTPLASGLSGSVLALALLRYQFLDVIPIARTTVLEMMREGMLVTDQEFRLVDINLSARRYLGLPAGDLTGTAVTTLFAADSEWIPLLTDPEDGKSTRLVLHLKDGEYVDAQRTALHNPEGSIIGYCTVLHDITELSNQQQRIEKLNSELSQQLVDIRKLQLLLEDQAIRDGLTGLFNRRYLDDILQREVARARRSGDPISVLMVDIDHFKQMNDNYGHRAGDDILIHLARYISSQVRDSDLICRYGGEEFVIILVGSNVENAAARANEICRGVRGRGFLIEGDLMHVTLSIGVAGFPVDGETPDAVLHAADMAMYHAKKTGRNKVAVFTHSFAD
jgi:diguanylate cyclase (GGDEF)-like protein/PAS domain S-box-containing protein